MISNGAGAACVKTEGAGAAPQTGRPAAADFNGNDPDPLSDPVTSEPTANNELEDVSNSNTEKADVKTHH